MSWTIDARCSRCVKKDGCEDRKELIADLSPLANKLNTETRFTASPGDGVLIVSCSDFAVA